MKKAQVNLNHLYRSLGENIRAEFYPYSSIKHTIRRRDGDIFMRISDLFREAPNEVLFAIGRILLAKLNKKRISKTDRKIYDEFLGSRVLQQEASRRLPGRKRSLTMVCGRTHNLHDSFRRVNKTYFGNAMGKPLLTWSSQKAKRTLGKYDPERDAVIISRVLDSPIIPEEFVDFIMYHELLHKKHGILVKGARRQVHTKAFKENEQKFSSYEKMKTFMENLQHMNV